MKSNKPKSTADTRRAARGNVPGFLGLAELAKAHRAHCRAAEANAAGQAGAQAMTPKLPKSWRQVRNPDGTLVHYARLCGRYYVLPARDDRYVAGHWPDQGPGVTLGGYHETLTHALVACRDHAAAQAGH